MSTLTILDRRRRRATEQKLGSERKVLDALREGGEQFVTGIESRTGLGRDAAYEALGRLIDKQHVIDRPVKQSMGRPKRAFRIPGQPEVLQEQVDSRRTAKRQRREHDPVDVAIRGRIIAVINASVPAGLTRDELTAACTDIAPAGRVHEVLRQLWNDNELSYRLNGTYMTNRAVRPARREVVPGAAAAAAIATVALARPSTSPAV